MQQCFENCEQGEGTAVSGLDFFTTNKLYSFYTAMYWHLVLLDIKSLMGTNLLALYPIV